MKKFILPLVLFFFPFLLIAQVVSFNHGEPYIFTSQERSEEIINLSGDFYVINFRNQNTIGQQFLSIPETCCTANLSSNLNYFEGSNAYNLFTEPTNTGSFETKLYTTGGIGDSPQNTDIFVTAKNVLNENIWATQLPLPGYDTGLKTIGTTDGGALTVAVVEDVASGLEQLRVLKHEPIAGTATWETYIPVMDTGYDIIFQGQVNGEFVYETQPTPPISIVKEVPDGYIIVNQNKLYSPPTANEQYANIIKIDLTGNLLWTNNIRIPWREIEIGSNSSANLGLRGRVTSVEGLADGSTYFTFSSSGDINPNAQFRKLDNTGAIIQSFSTSWILNDNYSWLIKEIDGAVYWVKLSGIFTDDGPPTNAFDFAIFNITNGITNVQAANNPLAFLPPTPGVTYIPKDFEILENGDFLVVGDYYESLPFPDFGITNAASQPFVVRLQNQNLNSSPDINLTVTADNEAANIYNYVELTYTVTNEGTAPTTGVTAKIERNSSAVIASEFDIVASQGNLDAAFSESATWDIGTLAAGQTETLTLTYFTLAENTIFYGEISAMNETDSDSTPNNGTFGDPQEDDEAGVDIGQQPTIIRGTVFLDENRDGGENCSTDGCTFIEGIQINLYIQGTTTLVGTAVSQANGEYIFPNVPAGSYTLEYEYQNNFVPTPYFNGPFEFEFRNNFLDINGQTPYIGVFTSNANPERVYNLGLVDGTECTLEALFVETICDDNGTPSNPNDDTFNVNFRADGQGRAAFSLNSGNGALWNNSITYTEGFKNIGPFDVSELPVTLTVNNLANLPSVSCSLSETITSVDCGTTGGSQPDLTVTATGTIPASIQPGENYPSAVDFTNSGASFANTSFANRIYISTDASLDASDIWVSGVGSNGLAAGETIPFLNIFVPEDIELGEYFILAVTDAINQVEESNENNNVLARPVTIGPVGTGDVDLELTASAEVPNIYQNGEAVFTLTNTGSQTATNIEILFAKNSSLNITGVPTASQGSTDVHWTDAPEWSVGSLAAGQSATITFGVFSLSDTPTLYGQLVFQGEVDVDSTPDNGNGMSVNEDDEAIYPSTEVVNCEISIADFSQPICNDNGTPDLAIDDYFTFSFTPTVGSPGGFYLVNVPEIIQDNNVTYTPVILASGTPLQQGFNINDAQLAFGNTINYTVSYPDFSCSEDIEIIIPESCSNGGEGFSVTCASNITPPLPVQVDPNDDYSGRVITWNPPTATTDCAGGVTIEQINGPVSGSFFNVWTTYPIVYDITDECGNSQTCVFEIFVNGITGTLQCPDDIIVDATSAEGAVVTFGDAIPVTSCNASPVGPASSGLQSGDTFPIGTTELEFSTFFTGSAAFCQNFEMCTTTITVLPEGGGTDGVDLELTASADAPAIWQSGTAIFTISNNGNTTATGIELEFAKNNTLNITGTPTVSQGTSQVHWTDTPRWNVGTLAAGQSATITYDIFAISEAINFYGQVTAQNEADADSAPNNGNGTTPNEDDETSFPNGGDTGSNNQADLTLGNLNITGTGGAGDVIDYTVLVSNIGTAAATGNYLIGAYLSTDNQLDATDIQVGVINTGNTPIGSEPLTTGAITIPANQNPGNYFLILETDTNENIAESNENNNLVSTPIFISVVDSACLLNIQIGTVSCSTAGTPSDPSDDTYNFTFTVLGQNVSNTANMSANVNVPSTVNLGQSYTITGTSASIAQVNLTATDPDDTTCQSSASVNPPGTCGQDTGGGGCGLSAEVVSVSCLQNMADDRYNFVIRVDVAEGSDTENWSLAFPNQTNYAGTTTFYPQGSAAIADGVQTLEVIDQDNSACNVQVTVTPPTDCENIAGCQLGVQATNIACTGDNFSFRLYVNSVNFSDSGTDWTGVFPLADGSGGTFEIVRPINGSVFTNDNYINYSTADVEQYLGGEINYTVYHNSNPSCTIDGTLYLTTTGCDPNLAAAGDIDLSLDIQVPQNVVPYQNFETDYIVYNDGAVTATDVEVDVRLFNSFGNNAFVLQGGNEATPSQGEFDGEFGSTWTVGSIAPGGSATLTLNMFSLEIGSSEIYGQVSQHNERDVDSNPDNYILDNFILIEREDDEKLATVTVSSNFQGGNTSNFTQQLNGLSATLYPVPTRDNLTVDIFMENALETQLSIVDTNGKKLLTRNLAAQKGVQTIQFSATDWAKGVYFLQLVNEEEMKTYRFVKQ